ncbi:energy-coupling factor transporter ATPase [Alkalihalobacillus pseudalcaliphilus]|uniref:energy-coupling factor transporter ATPase n=1 Tax=Alkalihalobacillus pseudalcaliphilus TaxID=79884 RepID=UPI00064E0D77|nr:energy-coupling factor transporter ATPase [Alkalihalobacillus pseudalcaliphilus]KMK74892.1 cobalt transporter ATP-binding subunit [Alkalihalobacillus pseudalcaliphilus]
MDELIIFENVTYRYLESDVEAVSDIQFSVPKSQWLSIVGRNGSGKSTIGKLMNGLVQPSSGTVYVRSLPTNKESNLREIRLRVGMVFQNPEHQFVATNVRDDIAFGLENQGVQREEMLKQIDFYAELIGIKDLLDREPHRLSGGQKQRVAICGVLVLEPDVLVFDESTSMLDPSGRKEVRKIMELLKSRGITIISITHDMEEAWQADRLLVLERGQIIADNKPIDIFNNQDLLQRAGLQIPFVLAVQKKLIEQGIPLSATHESEDDVLEELWTLHSQT